MRAILTDIEGTTSSLAFVKDVLFPYSRDRLPAYVRAHRHEPQVAQLLADTAAAAGKVLDTEGAIAQLVRWIDEDRKITPLKALQGLIWEQGYRARDFHGHIYDDAVARLRAWSAAGLKLYVYSSGSVKAQQLLFGHTEYGDLTPLFAGYFDTTVGGKREADAYKRIAGAIGLPPTEILFLSDIREELDAARAAGMGTYWLVRDGAVPVHPAHPVARDFNDIKLDRGA